MTQPSSPWPRQNRPNGNGCPASRIVPGSFIPICLGLTVMLAYIAKDLTYDHNLLHMQARNLESVQWEEKLIQCTTGTSWHALSYTTTPEESLALKARFEKLPEVSQVFGVAELVPLDQERKLEQLRAIQKSLHLLPERGKIDSARPGRMLGLTAENAKALHASLENLEGPYVHKLRDSLLFLIAQN